METLAALPKKINIRGHVFTLNLTPTGVWANFDLRADWEGEYPPPEMSKMKQTKDKAEHIENMRGGVACRSFIAKLLPKKKKI